MKLVPQTAPYIRKSVSVKRMMLDVIIALLPVTLFAVIQNGWGAIYEGEEFTLLFEFPDSPDIFPKAITVDGWEKLYEQLFNIMQDKLSKKAKDEVFFELIFMTYSYVHNAINTEAFPKALKIFDKEKFVGRGKGKYSYKKTIKDEAEKYIKTLLKEYFPEVPIIYSV